MLFRSSRVVRSLSFATHLHFHLKRRPIKAMPRAYYRSVGFGAELASEGDEPPEMKVRGITFRCIRNEHGERIACFAVLLLLHVYGLLRIPHPLLARRTNPNIITCHKMSLEKCCCSPSSTSSSKHATSLSPKFYRLRYSNITDVARNRIYVRHNNRVAESHVNGLNDLSYNKKFSTRFSLPSR